MATGDTQDIVQGLKSALPRGWFGSSTPVLDALLTGLAAAWSGLYSMYQYVAAQSRIATATGVWLDLAALDFFGPNLPRMANEQDTQYRARIRAALFVEQGTRSAIYSTLLRLTGRAPIIFEPARPADTGAYTQALPSYENRWTNAVRGNSQASAARSLTLAATDASAADYYANSAVRIVAGPGAGQERKGLTSRQNLLCYSQEFDNAAWVKSGTTTVTANSAVAPDGTLTAATVADIDATAALIYQATAATLTAGTQLLASIYIAQGTSAASTFNMVNGATGEVNSTLTWSGGLPYLSNPVNCTHSIASVGNGWYRWSILFTMAATAPCVFRFWPTLRDNPALTGTAFVWGAQLEAGSVASEYIRTEAAAATGVAIDRPWSRNMLVYSQAFDNAAWSKAQCTATANAAAAPDGSATAEIITTSASIYGAWMSQTMATPSLANQVVTFSIHVKIGTISPNVQFAIWLRDGANNNYADAWFNMSTGTVVASFGSAATQNLGNGWFRWSASGTFPAGAAPGFLVQAGPGNSVVAGDTYYQWGAQLEIGAACSAYAATLDSPISPPDASSVYDIGPGAYATAWPANASLQGYGAAGGYGSLAMPYQALVIAYLPSTAGIPLVAGYNAIPSPQPGVSYPAAASNGAYNLPTRTEYAALANAQENPALNAIYQAVDAAKAAGTIVWVGARP